MQNCNFLFGKDRAALGGRQTASKPGRRLMVEQVQVQSGSKSPSYRSLANSAAFQTASLNKRSIWRQLKKNREDERQVEASGITIHVDSVVVGIRASAVLANVMAKSPVRRRAMFTDRGVRRRRCE
ncbi:hypothetical protein ASPBRDRAFT_570217 [Aspergillus brasiliensis CBS 101740]|uniref:Uncharacterized protein n=1 Tax=Aspergillus brasiliensis (strain CBS 101740 / IMI 381727 / IBT 21946) TaxID=767769 RepID=A0A1L9UIT0_ASPBC|nr:hypothetical protein ASPBRDRAFT_570217 [Aspergillus brasiliensis CBS 101740]